MPRRRHKWNPICDPPQGLVRPVRADPTRVTGPTRAQARGRRWRCTSHGYYVPASVDGSQPEQRILEKSVLLPPQGAVTGWAACRIWGAAFFDGLLPDGATEIPVPLCVGPQLHRKDQDGVRYLRDRLDPHEVVVRHGIPVVRQERAVFDAMRLQEDPWESVVAMDMAAAGQVTSIQRMRSYTDAHGRWNGVPRVRWALDHADEDSRSPNETRLRLIWQFEARLPRPLVNTPVWNRRGRLLGYADLLDPVAGVVGEFDGADHRGAARHSADVDREAGFRNHLLEFFRVTGLDLRDRRLVVARMAATFARAKRLPEDRRPWTLTPPPGWEPDRTLDELLDERDFYREVREKWLQEGDPDIGELIRM